MSKICGYNCEHNKSGVCQITGCSKKSYMSDKTETELFRETWYDINQIRQLQQENKQLKMIVNEYERLNKGFKITNVQEYNIDELLSYKKYKDNWNYIKKMLKEAKQEKFNVNGYCGTCTDVDIDFLLNKMQELEQGSDSNVKD